MSSMTLEQVRDWHRAREASFANSTSTLFSKEDGRAKRKHRAMADAIDAHLTTPAQTVDVEAVKTLLELVEGEHGGDHTEADCRYCVAFNKLSQAIGDKA